jgi:hypothetical protein
MTDTEKVKVPPTYVVHRGKPIDKFDGYAKTDTYMADEDLDCCDCQGFVKTGHCKHLDLKGLLNQFKTDELIFFGKELGDCKAKNERQIQSIATELLPTLLHHFQFDALEVAGFLQNPMDATLYNCIKFRGKRKKNTLIVGYAHGIMFMVEPG